MLEKSEFSDCLLKLWPEQLTNIGAQKCPLSIEEEATETKLENSQGSQPSQMTRSCSSEENLIQLMSAKPLKTNQDLIELSPLLPARFPFAKSPEFKSFPAPSRDRTTPRRLSAKLSCEMTSPSAGNSPRQTPCSPTFDSPIHSSKPATPREKEQSPREEDVTQSKSPPSLISTLKIEKPTSSSSVSVKGSAGRSSEPRAMLGASRVSTSNVPEESTSSTVSLSFWKFSPPDINEKDAVPKGFVRPTRKKTFPPLPAPTESEEKDQSPKNPKDSIAESLQGEMTLR